jgi:hypothetical protein
MKWENDSQMECVTGYGNRKRSKRKGKPTGDRRLDRATMQSHVVSYIHCSPDSQTRSSQIIVRQHLNTPQITETPATRGLRSVVIRGPVLASPESLAHWHGGR